MVENIQQQAQVARAPAKTPKFIASPTDVVLYLLTALGVFILAVLLWAVGGHFTIVAINELLRPWGVSIALDSAARWFIPAIISAIEVTLFKLRDRLPSWILGVGVVITFLDFASTVYGIIVAIGGANLNFLTGYTVPPIRDQNGSINMISLTIGLVGSGVLTFAPEQMMLQSAEMLQSVISGLRSKQRGVK